MLKLTFYLCLSLFKENFIGNKQGLLQYFGPSSDHYQAKYCYLICDNSLYSNGTKLY